MVAGPRILVAVVLLTAAPLIAASLLPRARLRNRVGSFGFAAAVLGAIAAAAVLGTMIVQQRPPSFYAEHHPHAGRAILALGLGDVFHSCWFAALIGLLVAGLVVSGLNRWPVRLHNAGLFACHLGVLATLAGTGVSMLYGVRGRLDLRAGAAPTRLAAALEHGRPTGVSLTLPFTVALDRLDVDRYASEYRIAAYTSNPDGSSRLEATFSADPGKRHRLPHRSWFRALAYYPDMVLRDRVAPATGGVPVLRVGIDDRELWLPDGGRTESDDGRVAVEFDWQPSDRPQPVGGHRVAEDGAPAVPIQIGETRTLPSGRQITARRFFPHYDGSDEVPANIDELPENPALEVEIAALRSGPQLAWLQARTPQIDLGDGGPRLSYVYDTDVRPPQLLIHVAGASRIVRVLRDGEKRDLRWDDGLDLAGGRIRLGALLPSALRTREPATASAEPRNPAVLIELADGGERREHLLVAAEHSTVGFALSDVLTFERRDDQVRRWRAQLTIGEHSGSIAVNKPLERDGWTFYPTGFDPDDPTVASVEVVHDPGVRWVFAGFVLIGLGAAYVFYVEPLLRREA